jgi:hypothetical protein
LARLSVRPLAAVRRRQRKKLHAKYVADLRYELTLSRYWRERLLRLSPDETMLITAEELRASQIEHRWVPAIRYRLRYSVSVRPLPNGLVEFSFNSSEFPAVLSWSHNNPEVV